MPVDQYLALSVPALIARPRLSRGAPGPSCPTSPPNGRNPGQVLLSKVGGVASPMDEALDSGRNSLAPVSAACPLPHPYAGRATRVTGDLL